MYCRYCNKDCCWMVEKFRECGKDKYFPCDHNPNKLKNTPITEGQKKFLLERDFNLEYIDTLDFKKAGTLISRIKEKEHKYGNF